MEFRGRILQAVEAAQKSGVITNPLEARIVATVAEPALRALLETHKGELEELFILSDLEICDGETDFIDVARTGRLKCERCWRHRSDVGSRETHPALCERCAAAVESCGGVAA
jgi:isoleucyl-tRNA synthetase